jgi:hypothetical protein
MNSKQRMSAIAIALLAGLPAAYAALPAEQTQGSVSWVSGGVGEGQAAEFKAAQRSYPLAIEMSRAATPRNEYVSDADVRISDMKGQTVLQAKADGPYMLVKLPPGTYRVEATLGGKTARSGPLKVAAQGSTHASLVFPENTDNGR